MNIFILQIWTWRRKQSFQFVSEACRPPSSSGGQALEKVTLEKPKAPKPEHLIEATLTLFTSTRDVYLRVGLKTHSGENSKKCNQCDFEHLIKCKSFVHLHLRMLRERGAAHQERHLLLQQLLLSENVSTMLDNVYTMSDNVCTMLDHVWECLRMSVQCLTMSIQCLRMYIQCL